MTQSVLLKGSRARCALHRRASGLLEPRAGPLVLQGCRPCCRHHQPAAENRFLPHRASRRSVAASGVQAPVPQRARQQSGGSPIPAGPPDSPPDYSNIDAKLHNRFFMHIFRRAVVDAVGEDAPEPGFDGIITLTRRLSRKFEDPRDSRALVRRILVSLFPPALLPAFKVMFARSLPAFSHWLNALVTAQACQWLMGPSAVSDVELDDGTKVAGHGVRVERCRVLEQSGCASVCVNCCKLPTQEFFAQEMGLDLRMTPNYEDFSCQFNFGQKPLAADQDPALCSPCFLQCPSKSSHRTRPLCSGLDAVDS